MAQTNCCGGLFSPARATFTRLAHRTFTSSRTPFSLLRARRRLPRGRPELAEDLNRGIRKILRRDRVPKVHIRNLAVGADACPAGAHHQPWIAGPREMHPHRNDLVGELAVYFRIVVRHVESVS